MRYLSAVPAYGRDYKTAREVKTAWADGKDFRIQDFKESGYVNKDDKPANVILNIRYSNLTKVVVIK